MCVVKRSMWSLAAITVLLGLATGTAFAQTAKAKAAPSPAAALPPVPVPAVVDTGAAKREAAGYFAQGYDAWKAGNLDIARELFDRGLALDPVNADALFYAGEVARAKRDFAAAEGHYKRSLAANPDGRNAIPAQGALASLEKQAQAMELFAAAFDAEKAGNLTEAKRLYEDGLKRANDPQARTRLEVLNDKFLREAEDAAWKEAFALKTVQSIQSYLTRYPAGRYVQQANEILPILRRNATLDAFVGTWLWKGDTDSEIVVFRDAAGALSVKRGERFPFWGSVPRDLQFHGDSVSWTWGGSPRAFYVLAGPDRLEDKQYGGYLMRAAVP